jgi:hypothetical protein
MMDYQHQQQFGNLPAGSSEKMLLWAQPTQYMADSGYTTQAPSISSIDAFLNEDQMDSTLNATQSPAIQHQAMQQQQQQQQKQEPIMHQLQPSVQHQQQSVQAAHIQHENETNLDWMNSQDHMEAAIKAIPDLVVYLRDEDYAVVSQTSMIVNQMSRKKASCLALIDNENIIQSLVNCLSSDINAETAKNVVGSLYNISMHKKGINNIIQNNAIQALMNLLR